MRARINWMKSLIKKESVFFSLLALCGVCWFVFLKFCSEVMEGESHAFDQSLIVFVRDHSLPDKIFGQLWFAEMMRDLTGLGGIIVISLITLATTIYFLILKKYGQGLYVLMAIASGATFSNLLKIGFNRPRPDIIPHGSFTILPGFPSGHSMISAIVYLTLGAMLTTAHQGRAIRIYIIGLSITLTILIGISRLYLGVHWPSDILAGWIGGAAWALMVWILYKHANKTFWARLHNREL